MDAFSAGICGMPDHEIDDTQQSREQCCTINLQIVGKSQVTSNLL